MATVSTGEISTTVAGVFLPILWSTETLRATERALVAAGLIKRYDAQVKSRGQSIYIPQVSNFAGATASASGARAKSADSDVTNDNTTEDKVTLSVDKWYYVAFKLDDMAAVQSSYDLRSEYSEKAGYAIARQVDTDVLGLYTTSTNTDVGTYGVDIGDATIVSALTALNLADMPMEDRAIIIHPNQLAAIMKIDKFVKADYLGSYQNPTPVVKGPNSRYMWGQIYGTPVYYTNNVPSTAGTPTQYHNIVLHKEAFALALQQAPRLQAAYWLPSLAWQVVVDVIYGVTGLRTTGSVEMRS